MAVDNKNCRDCVYFGGGVDEACCCNYILMTSSRRPCDPGEGCTVKKKRSRRRRMKADNYKINQVSQQKE